LIADAVADYDYPVCFDLPVGHTERNVPLLSGQPVELTINDAGTHLLYITD